MAPRLRLVTVDLTAVLRPTISVGRAYIQVIRPHQKRISGPALPHEDVVSEAFHSAYRKQCSRSPCFGHDDMPCKDWWEEVVRGTLSATGMKAYFLDVFEELYDGKFNGGKGSTDGDTGTPFWRMDSGTAEALAAVRTIWPTIVIGAVANGDERHRNLLHNLGLGANLDFVVASGEIGYSKPDAAFFNHCLWAAAKAAASREAGSNPHLASDQAAAVDPSEAIHIGASADKDVLGVLDAGWRGAGYIGHATMEIEDVFQLEHGTGIRHLPQAMRALDLGGWPAVSQSLF